jgi:hypothetical protein
MPAYNVRQPAGLAALTPGDGPYVMFDGTETPATTLASVAFARGSGGIGPPQGITFSATGLPSGCTVDIQVSETDVDGDYWTPNGATIGGDANGNGGYTDIGYSAFYRAKISAYTTGAMPVVKAQR